LILCRRARICDARAPIRPSVAAFRTAAGRALEAGFTVFLAKPARPQQLLKLVERLLAQPVDQTSRNPALPDPHGN